MNAAEFLRRRDRIAYQESRPHPFRAKALRALIQRAGAVPVKTGGRVQGYRLPSGEIVCTKRRFRDEGAAQHQLGAIARFDAAFPRPITPSRAYLCPFCGGWHLTHLPKTGNDEAA